MHSISVCQHQLGHIMSYCYENISARRFFLHNQIGGEGWKLYNDSKGWHLTTDDPRHLTFISLKFDQK